MYDFYELLRENMSFNKFEVNDLLFVEYNCPLDEDSVAIWTKSDYIIHVLSGKKKWRSIDDEWTVQKGETLYVKKGASIIDQFFKDGFCMLGFFVSDDIIRSAVNQLINEAFIKNINDAQSFAAIRVNHTPEIESFFNSMLGYFQKEEKPIDSLLELKARELIMALISANQNPLLSSYLKLVAQNSLPSLPHIMEVNFCYNLSLSEFARLCHRSVSSFKRDFQDHYSTTPGKWLLQRRLKQAAINLANQEDSISQITFSCGFENVSHFSRAFKKQYGMTPSDFKSTPK